MARGLNPSRYGVAAVPGGPDHPSSAVRASVAVEHAHVLKFHGYFTTPQLGALMEFVPGMRALGKPPSMTTITRDTYPPGAAFGGAFIRRVAQCIAAALEHLHARGISHGDMYAHNILVAPESGEAKLADFGAAFYYGAGTAHAGDYERMERRAFGALLAELLERHDASQPALLLPVRTVAHACLSLFGAADNQSGTAACGSFAGVVRRLAD